MRCLDGVHHFDERVVCQCAAQASGPERATPREGMVTVYDYFGRYLGCMGSLTWEDLLRDGEGEAYQDEAEDSSEPPKEKAASG